MNDTRLTPAVEPSDEEIRTFVAELRSQTNHWFFDDIYTVIVRAALARFAPVQKYDPAAVERLIEALSQLEGGDLINSGWSEGMELEVFLALAALRGDVE